MESRSEPLVTGWEPAGTAERTAADVSSLLVDLARVLKSISFYGIDNPATKALIDRAHRAWQADLARGGPLELSVHADHIAAAGVDERIPLDRLPELARAFDGFGIETLRLSGNLARDSFAGLVHALDLDELTARGDGFSAPPGIEVNGVAGALPALSEESPSDLAEPTARPEEAPACAPTLPSSASSPPVSAPTSPPSPSPSSAHESALHDALEALEACSGDDVYLPLAREVGDIASELARAGSVEAVHDAMLVLAGHASGGRERTALAAHIAHGVLCELAVGPTLDELIFRACSGDPLLVVRLSQVLLAIGENAAPAILDHLESAPTGPHAAQLSGLLIALGEAAATSLGAAIGSANATRASLAIRIAADLQAPALIAPLRAHLCRPGPHPKDAAKALVEIGTAAAVEALTAGAAGKETRIAEISVFCLGALGAPETLATLVERLHVASEEREVRLGREILASIRQFRTCNAVTTERLKLFICQPRIGLRRPPTMLRLEAVAALGQLSGPTVERTLRDIGGGSSHPRASARVRIRAQRILERRSALDHPAQHDKSLPLQ